MAAPRGRVRRALTDPGLLRRWAAEFAPGSHALIAPRRIRGSGPDKGLGGMVEQALAGPGPLRSGRALKRRTGFLQAAGTTSMDTSSSDSQPPRYTPAVGATSP